MFIILGTNLGTNDNIILRTLHFSSVLLLRDGFKSHLPHCYLEEESLLDYKGSFFVRPWALRALWDRAGILQNTGVIYNGIC